MSMTREDAAHILEYSRIVSENFTQEAVTATYVMALSALRGPTREHVEKVRESEWIDNGEREPNGVPKTFAISCKRCGLSVGTSWMRFCPACGAPMTDEGMQMVMERLEAENASAGSL